MKKGRWIQNLLLLVFLGVTLFSGWKLYGIYREYKVGTDLYDELAGNYVSLANDVPESVRNREETGANRSTAVKEESGIPTVDFSALKHVCEDVVAWVYCPETPINYPIVQGEDNEYYLHRLINGETQSGGTLFMDFRNLADFSDWNSIIYGHNMKNDSMFGILPDYMKQEFYEEHPIWYLMTEERSYMVEFVGGYVTAADSGAYKFPDSQEEKTQLAEMATRSSSFRSGVKVMEEERLITFSTCVYDYEDARYVLVGVLRNVDE